MAPSLFGKRRNKDGKDQETTQNRLARHPSLRQTPNGDRSHALCVHPTVRTRGGARRLATWPCGLTIGNEGETTRETLVREVNHVECNFILCYK
eukprot:s1076_g12.t1